MKQDTPHRYLAEEGRFTFLCETCPLNSLEPYNAAKGAARVDEASIKGQPIGKARSELGVMINACRLAQQNGDCGDPELLQGMFYQMMSGGGRIMSYERYIGGFQQTNPDMPE